MFKQFLQPMRELENEGGKQDKVLQRELEPRRVDGEEDEEEKDA